MTNDKSELSDIRVGTSSGCVFFSLGKKAEWALVAGGGWMERRDGRM